MWQRGWVGAGVDLVTHHSSYFCPSSSPLPSLSTSVTVKRYRWAVHPPVSLLQCLTHHFIITEHRRCNCGWGDSVNPDLDGVIQTSCASSHLSLFSSINRLLTDCTKFWKRQTKQKKFYLLPHSFSPKWSLFKTQLVIVCILFLVYNKRPICATQSPEKNTSKCLLDHMFVWYHFDSNQHKPFCSAPRSARCGVH